MLLPLCGMQKYSSNACPHKRGREEGNTPLTGRHGDIEKRNVFSKGYRDSAAQTDRSFAA